MGKIKKDGRFLWGLTVSDCNMLLKRVHPDVNGNPEARELTEKIILARKYMKNSLAECQYCGKKFRKRKKGKWVGKFCCQQCSAFYRHRGRKELNGCLSD